MDSVFHGVRDIYLDYSRYPALAIAAQVFQDNPQALILLFEWTRRINHSHYKLSRPAGVA